MSKPIITNGIPVPRSATVRSTSVWDLGDVHLHTHSYHKTEDLANKSLERTRFMNEANPGDKLLRQYITRRDERGRFAPEQKGN